MDPFIERDLSLKSRVLVLSTDSTLRVRLTRVLGVHGFPAMCAYEPDKYWEHLVIVDGRESMRRALSWMAALPCTTRPIFIADASEPFVFRRVQSMHRTVVIYDPFDDEDLVDALDSLYALSTSLEVPSKKLGEQPPFGVIHIARLT